MSWLARFKPYRFTGESRPCVLCGSRERTPVGTRDRYWMPLRNVLCAGCGLVFTDAFTGNWVPKEGAPFMVAEITFEDAGPGKTKYTATARHWTAETKAQHEQMGFVPGWTQCARQLEELAKTL